MGTFLKQKRLHSFISILLILSFLLGTIHISATKVLAQTAVCTEARADADEKVNKVAWAIPGFLCGIFGFAIAYFSEPAIPADKLIGKSEDEVREYTTCYKETAKKHQWQSACVGWALGTSVSLIMLSSGN